MVTVSALVPAAGLGVRLGGGVPKALRVLRGEPLIVHALRGLQACTELSRCVVAAPPGQTGRFEDLLGAAGLRLAWQVVAGEDSRQASVARALAALDSVSPDSGQPAGTDIVLVHDAARCLVPVDVIQRVVDAVRDGAEAVVPVVPVADTVKQVAGDTVVATVDRAALRQAQTPQGFRHDVLTRSYAALSGPLATDDAGLAERSGATVRVVDGHPHAFKITGPLDLLLAEALLR
ncbi:MAG: 2-C-methyl-D-erythritol 4-phosphate cytidylyltransferase [Nocardioidaceae bacterium]|nr:2-C-methyl-D-erythritol 4-phosphate cytidylyltransferase [Nocardioidaceae bacterium]